MCAGSWGHFHDWCAYLPDDNAIAPQVRLDGVTLAEKHLWRYPLQCAHARLGARVIELAREPKIRNWRGHAEGGDGQGEQEHAAHIVPPSQEMGQRRARKG